MKRKLGVMLVGMIALLFYGCSNSVNYSLPEENAQKGSLSIKFTDSVSRSILPAQSMDISSYTITGTGPTTDYSFTKTVAAGSSATITDLFPGNWTIQVDAYNDSNTLIGTGSGSVTISIAKASTLSVTVSPLSGTGTLSLSVSWVAADLKAPSIVASLTPISGSMAQTLAFTLGTDKATYTDAALAAGFYTLQISLKDSGVVVAGSTETVRIVKGQTTSGAFSFDKLMSVTGVLSLTVSSDIKNPLTINISGAAETKASNQTLNLSASATGATGIVTWTWYVDGVSSGTGSTFAFGADYPTGIHRIVAVGIDATGGTAGSATAQIEVTPPEPDGFAYTILADGSGYSVALGTKVINGPVVIPELYNGLPVKAVATSGFEACTALTSITLPGTILEIGIRAFNKCTRLTTVTMADGVITVGGSAFMDCTGLTSISLPDTVESVGASAFSGCVNLSSVKLSARMQTVSDYLFNGCVSLENLDIPVGVTSIGSYAFQNAKKLSSMTIPEGVTKIGSYAYDGCFALSKVVLPTTLSRINGNAFFQTSSLASIDLPEGITFLGSDCFSQSGLTSVSIPGSLVGVHSFRNCSNLSEVVINEGITTILPSAFSGSKVSTITLPGSLTSIDPDVFGSYITTVIITSSTVVTWSPFLARLTSLKQIKVPAALLDAYKASPYWTDLASKFVAM